MGKRMVAVGQRYLTKDGIVSRAPSVEPYKVSVKVYYAKYDLQGDEVLVDRSIKTVEDWNEAKKHLVDDYVNHFTVRGGYPVSSDFGVGVYKDNKENRLKGRVGRTYSRGKGLLSEIDSVLSSGGFDVARESQLVNEIKSSFNEEEVRKSIYEKFGVYPVRGLSKNVLLSILSGRRTGAQYFEGEAVNSSELTWNF